MELKDVILIGIAMSMDALGLTISLGINPYLVKRNKIRFILSFSFFQFLFLFLGGVTGRFFDTYVVSIPSMIGGIIIALIGLIMIISAFNNSDKDDSLLISKSMHIILGMSVSIDALVVGFTAFYQVNPILTFIDSILVGLITLFLCTTGFFLCRYARRVDFICKYADIIGGLILLGLGLEMIVF
ncbi:manganese efflux pump [Clostridium sp. AL.422]|uniref:manganese efflux pump n=1 Tax=Clostridium TaxID=1485 RepID=UPI00293DA6F1|nr:MULTISPECIES: manganese efflux pump [unclassified Clostridium]MDV4149762.1 manganese efflux pump [Clostridium sp. AL.422]